MIRPLKGQVKEYLSQFNLTDQQFHELEKSQSDSLDKIPKRIFQLSGLAASLVILAFIGYFWKTISTQINFEKLPGEIAYHHNKRMDSEIKTHSYPEMKSYLSKLDFNLIASKRLPSEEWELMGGRYCSLQGRLAAQIKIRNKKNNKIYTLYQLAIPENIKKPIRSFESYSGGAKVQIWSESGLLLGIAGDE